jgi:glutamine cyclotransferase
MRFSEVIQALMAGGGNAVWRQDWGGQVFLRYSEVWNIFELHGPKGRVTQLEELSLSPGDLFANDWAIVVLDPRTGEVAK